MNEIDVRTRILDVATRLFGERGYGATSVREVVDAAGVTKPTLYYWFENKDALFVEAVERQVRKLKACVSETLGLPGHQTTGSIEARLGAFVERYIATALDDAAGCRLMMTAQHPVHDGQPEIDLLSVHKESLAAVASVLDAARARRELRADVDPSIAALSLVGAANLCIVAALHGMPVPGDVHTRILRNFLTGVRP